NIRVHPTGFRSRGDVSGPQIDRPKRCDPDRRDRLSAKEVDRPPDGFLRQRGRELVRDHVLGLGPHTAYEFRPAGFDGPEETHFFSGRPPGMDRIMHCHGIPSGAGNRARDRLPLPARFTSPPKTDTLSFEMKKPEESTRRKFLKTTAGTAAVAPAIL